MPRTLISIDRESSEPIYRQVRRGIERGIATGTFDLSHRLPSSRELAEELSVSRNTVTLAYEELIAEGLIQGRERKGLFVNSEMEAARAHQPSTPAPQIQWDKRIRSFPDADLPHVEKWPDWHTYAYPFVAGQVDIDGFPARDWVRCLRDALYKPHAYASLRDSVGDDDPMLVDQIRRQLLPSRGIHVDPAQIMITVGSQQGMDLLATLLLNSRSTVALEDPGYLDARHIFRRSGARVYGVPVDERGVRPPEDLTGTDLMMVTPSHHHPTNVTMAMERRIDLLSKASRAGTILIEDDYDSEFRYQGSPTPALKALDETGDVVYLGTFSKFLSPGLRLGYLVGPEPLVRELRQLRRYVLRHPSGHQQRAMALLIESGDYHRSLRRQRGRLKERWEAITAAAEEFLPWHPTDFPPGGMSLWVTGPPRLDAPGLSHELEAQGVLLERGDIYYYADPPPRNHLRLGYAAIPLRSIRDGMRILGEGARRQLR
ncbi:PLP-dependent aminotransferase family protein [Leekyejoonella antrihumi]|uniref:PLP-dependent aminotransferase family protein n=1 Tax=Leekyejoonella antrihumi TaxID=1660198 RepID=A0A563E0H2_9MICO|nr:PLP-dependent aminotransferase family protein [Leekyejoonella antrihumi]TWP36040.1 PLP-dependent aminotransferase family protein [Leekyejoonella antrihumi]